MVSIIIPVYNVQEYLKQSIESTLKQSYKSIEVILVDDGSKDLSGQICDEYANKDVRVKVVHTINGGAAKARNIGLSNARGEYVIFLDGDDWYEHDTLLNELIITAYKEKADVVCFNYKKYFEKNKKTTQPILPQDSLIKDEEKMMELNIYNCCPWNKLIKKQLLEENMILFENGTMSEDIIWNAKLFLSAKNICYCGKSFYIYRQRKNSITSSISQNHIKDLISITNQLYIKKDLYDKRYCTYVAYQYCTLLINAGRVKVDKDTWDKIYSMKDILQYDINKNVHQINMFYKIFGIKLTSKALLVYFMAKNRV